MEKLKVGEIMLSYERKGKGTPLLLLPGIGASHIVWQQVVERLARSYDVIALDLPGLGGESDPLPQNIPSSVETLADAVEAFTKQLGLKKVHLVGNSLGGGIALELAKRNVAQSVTVFSPIGFWSSGEVLYAKTLLISLRRFARLIRPLTPFLLHVMPLRAIFYSIFFGKSWNISQKGALRYLDDFLDSPSFMATIPLTAKYRFHSEKPLSLPITIAWGTRDILLWHNQTHRIKSLLPNAKIILLKGSGHVPMRDNPEKVCEVIESASQIP